MVPKSVPYSHPVWAPFKPLTAPLKPLTAPFRIPLQPCTGAPFKGEWLIAQKPDKYQNDQHDKMSTVVPELTPYACPIWAPFNHLMVLFKIPLQPHAGAPFKGDNFPIQHHKIHQNVQLNKQRKMHPSRSSKHSQQPS